MDDPTLFPYGGKRKGAGRRPIPPHLKKISYGTKLPRWLCEWLARPEREKSAAVLIEEALCKVHKLKAPDKDSVPEEHAKGRNDG